MRGDRPVWDGWDLADVAVYPACAGIDLPLLFVRLQDVSLPRMRGDRPSRVKVEPRM